jgi:hypothetical protein
VDQFVLTLPTRGTVYRCCDYYYYYYYSQDLQITPERIKSDKRERERERERDHKLGLQDSLIDFFHYKVSDLAVVAAGVYT